MCAVCPAAGGYLPPSERCLEAALRFGYSRLPPERTLRDEAPRGPAAAGLPAERRAGDGRTGGHLKTL